LQRNDTLRFHWVENDQLICWSKRSADGDDTVLVVVNLDPWNAQSGWLHLDLGALGVEPGGYRVTDLLTNAHYDWQSPDNFVQLDPASVPAHVFLVHAS
jgi:starch synthase (maltosyl-transferring)